MDSFCSQVTVYRKYCLFSLINRNRPPPSLDKYTIERKESTRLHSALIREDNHTRHPSFILQCERTIALKEKGYWGPVVANCPWLQKESECQCLRSRKHFTIFFYSFKNLTNACKLKLKIFYVAHPGFGEFFVCCCFGLFFLT